MPNPVAKLSLALYGHPDSPTLWEDYCNEKVKVAGFESLGAEWPSTFWHPWLRLMLAAYVDDFKMAGPRENAAEGWKLLREHTDVEDPVAATLQLGCG